MKTLQRIYIFVEKNLGHGFEHIYPDLSALNLFLLKLIIRKRRGGLSRYGGFLLYNKVEIDLNCPDPRAQGRYPKIEMTAVFPWNFEEKLLYSETFNTLLKECWDRALKVSTSGSNSQMILELPEQWYKFDKEASK